MLHGQGTTDTTRHEPHSRLGNAEMCVLLEAILSSSVTSGSGLCARRMSYDAWVIMTQDGE